MAPGVRAFGTFLFLRPNARDIYRDLRESRCRQLAFSQAVIANCPFCNCSTSTLSASGETTQTSGTPRLS